MYKPKKAFTRWLAKTVLAWQLAGDSGEFTKHESAEANIKWNMESQLSGQFGFYKIDGGAVVGPRKSD